MSTATDIIKELKSKKIDVCALSDESSPCIVNEWLSTGCAVLDSIMGGGIPIGRLVEFYGDPSSGKSLIAAQIAAVAQQSGCVVAYADTESAVSIPMMKELGVDVDNLIYGNPDTVEEIFELFDNAIDVTTKIAPDKSLILIWDSVAATSSKAELENDYGKTGYLTHARVISQSLRKIMRKFSRSSVAAIFLNQTRENLGVLFGDKETTFGGKAIPFHASIRVQLHLSSKIKMPIGKKTRIIGMNTRALVVKNKVAMPYREASLPVYFGHGINDSEAAFTYLLDAGVLTKSGTQYYHLEGMSEDDKFTKAKWEDLFFDNYDAIYDQIMDVNAGITDEEPTD